jgi:hypothetical protein
VVGYSFTVKCRQRTLYCTHRTALDFAIQDEAVITINGTKLNDSESMIVRIAIETLENVLGKGLGFEDDGIPLTDVYLTSLSRVQALLE